MTRVCFPLSFSQKNILDLEMRYPGIPLNHISTTMWLDGDADLLLLQKSISHVLKRDDTLRTRLKREGEQTVQYYEPFEEPQLEIYDFTGTDEKGISSYEETLIKESMELWESPLYRFVLFRVSENRAGVFIKLHHLISDGHAQLLLCSRIKEEYERLLGEAIAECTDFPTHPLYGERDPEETDDGEEQQAEEEQKVPGYDIHVNDELAYLRSRQYQRDQDYWKGMFEEQPEAAALKPMTYGALSPAGKRTSLAFPEELNRTLSQYCSENGVSVVGIYYMALAVYLRKIGGEKKFAIGVPIADRGSRTDKQSTGMFVSTLPFCFEIHDDWAVDEFQDEFRVGWYNLMRYRRYPFSQISDLAKKDGRLFHIALSYQDGVMQEPETDAVRFSGIWHYSGYQAEQLCIHLGNLEEAGRYTVSYDYLTQCLSEEEVLQFHDRLVYIMEGLIRNPRKKICDMEICREEERSRVIFDFNQNTKEISDKDLYDMFLEQVEKHPDKSAVICRNMRVSYRELKEMADKASRKLIMDGHGGPGKVIAVLLQRDPRLYAGMIAILQSQAGYLLISEQTPIERIQKILAQSQAEVLLTEWDVVEKPGEPLFADIEMYDVDELFADDLELMAGSIRFGRSKTGRESIPEVQPASEDDLAYIVYTSGSTGTPKGVEISRRNLKNLAAGMEDVYASDTVLSVCNLGFDAFVLESSAALLCGRTVLLPKDEDLENPDELGRLMRRYEVGMMCMTPSRLQSYMKSARFRQAVSEMKCIICGGEAFGRELLRQLKRTTKAVIYNQYGPSETCVAVSMQALNHADTVTIGSPMPNCRMYVLDPWKHPVPEGAFGQLYIGGLCVGRGYRNNEKLTAGSYMEDPFVPGGRMYATGDLAYWTKDGQIVLGGRIDKQLKIRGLRIEPDEVIQAMLSCPGVTDAAVKVCEVNGQMILVGYYCGDSSITEMDMMGALSKTLPYYMVPVSVIRLDTMPLSPNGKIAEDKLPLPEEKRKGRSVPETKLQRKLLAIFGDVLQEKIGIDDDLILAGITSLKAMEAAGSLEELLGRRILISDITMIRTVRKLSEYIEKVLNIHPDDDALRTKREFRRRTDGNGPEDYPLTSMQQGIYVQSFMDKEGLAYHMPGAFVMEEMPDLARLTEAFRQLIEDEAILRTCFIRKDGEVRAAVVDHVDFEIRTLDAEDESMAAGLFLQPFELDQAPLMRAAVWETKEGQCMLFMDVHHIIGDGLSTPILLERLEQIYRGEMPEESPFFFDVCEEPDEQTVEEDRRYWREKLTPLPEELDLPTDKNREKYFDFKGDAFSYPISPEHNDAIAETLKECGITPSVLFLGAYGILLSRVSRREELMVGMPVSLRRNSQMMKVCGPLLEMKPLRIRVPGEMTVSAYLQEIQKELIGMMEHPNCSLEDMIAMLGLARQYSANPIYRAAFSSRPIDHTVFTIAGQNASYKPVPFYATKTELFVELYSGPEGYQLQMEYASSLFEKETAEFYARSLEAIVCDMTGDGGTLLQDIRGIREEDHRRLTGSGPREAYELTPVQDRIRDRALKEASGPAVYFRGETITFGELQEMADRFRVQLKEASVPAGSCIGVALARTPWYLAAMLAILEEGCAYVPLKEDIPEKRLEYMKEKVDIPLILKDIPAYMTMTEELQKKTVGGDDLVNVVFTSGSTGRPKGVAVTHRNAANLCHFMEKLLIEADGPVLCVANPMFDIFIVETLIALACGYPVVLADEEEMIHPRKMARLMEDYQVRTIQMAASRLESCMQNMQFTGALAGVRLVMSGGEALPEGLAERVKSHIGGRLYNVYGPTETTVCATKEEVLPGRKITIGSPLENVRVYVCDEHLEQVFPTARGELCIAGDGVSKGYAGDPALTEELFPEDLFVKGQRMYRSGDMVRMRADGRIEFLGRIDNQVKINGQRIEIEEVESVMLQTGLVLSAAVIVKEQKNGVKVLEGFYQPKEDTVTAGELKAALQSILPGYMIPAVLIAVGEMPLNENGKTDHHALEEFSGRAALTSAGEKKSGDKETKEGPAAKKTRGIISELWKKTLNTEEIDHAVSFFDQGGESLRAMEVVGSYENAGIEMDMKTFYEYPTIDDQVAYLCAGEEKQDAVMITGATGFFGVHLLREVLDHSSSDVICLMRKGGADRLKSIISWYFGADYTNSVAGRLEVFEGDLTEEYFGRDREDYEILCGRIGEIWHCAADVRHYAANEEAYLAVNVGGTERMVRLAKDAGAQLHHISTASVSGDHLVMDKKKEYLFTEEDLFVGQNFEDSIYVKSKLLAECAVREAAEEGLKAHIYRLGRVVCRMHDGRFQKNPQENASWLLMRGLMLTGALPESMRMIPVDLTPVDWCAAAAYALRNAEGITYHLMNPKAYSMEQVLRIRIKDLRIVPDEEYDSILKECSRNTDPGMLTHLMNYWHDVKNNDHTIRISVEETARQMKAAGFTASILPIELWKKQLAMMYDHETGER